MKLRSSTIRGGVRLVRFFGATSPFVVVGLVSLLPVAAAMAQNTFPSDCLPPTNSAYAGQFHAKYSDGTNVYDLSQPQHDRFTSCDPPPAPVPGACTDHTLGSNVVGQVSINGGPGMPWAGNGPMRVEVCGTGQFPPTRFFDTEMLQLDLVGTGGIMIRESPTRQSLGKTSITDLGGGSWRIDSFFDVFTELSLDGGQSWYPSTDSNGNPYAGRMMIPGTVAVNAATWSNVKTLFQEP